jgi:hypothetical protein
MGLRGAGVLDLQEKFEWALVAVVLALLALLTWMVLKAV